jgi:competence protein ComEA
VRSGHVDDEDAGIDTRLRGREPGPSEAIRRPPPVPGTAQRVREWIDWFGLTRLVTSAVAVVTVCAGAFWLVRTPVPPSEAALPIATTPVGGPVATLTPPAPAPGPGDLDGADGGAQGGDGGADVDGDGDGEAGNGAGVVIVHVAGAVANPGVYELAGPGRVDDAIEAAGGETTEADVDVLNLAAPLVDGSRIYVPTVGEEVPPEILVDTPPAPQTPSSVDAPAGPLDVNHATAAELETLPGVGPATAAAIVTERDRNGPFATVDDLDRVPGIGPAKLAALTDLVTT